MSSVESLTDEVHGSVITPDAGAYDEARRLYNAMFDKQPAVIVTCASRDDVNQNIRLAV